MKNTLILSLLFIVTLTIISCKQEKKKTQKLNTTLEKGYSIDIETSTINWTAYKTTDKVPVKGEFTSFSIENQKKEKTPKEALDGLQFNIPVNSLITKDTIRDKKLKQFFFGSMENTAKITGTLHMASETKGNATISMNGISHTLPINYVISEQMVKIDAIMNLDNWKVQVAMEALNLACKELHTGADGISKTWDEVKIEVALHLKNQ